MTRIGLIDPGDESTFELDWDDEIGDATLSAVTHTLRSPLVRMDESIDVANARSFVKARGAVHGMLYLVEARATLSDGQVLNRQFPLRCFNG